MVRGLAPRWGLEQPRGQAGGHRQASFAHLRHLLQQQRPCPPGPPPKLALAFFCASLFWRGHACWWGHADRAAAPADHAAQARTLWRSRDGVRTAAQPRRAARAMQTRRTDRRCAQRGSQPATPGSRRPCHQPGRPAAPPSVDACGRGDAHGQGPCHEQGRRHHRRHRRPVRRQRQHGELGRRSSPHGPARWKSGR